MKSPLWISEADVVRVMRLGEAIDAVEKGLVLQAQDCAHSMVKTHVSWGRGNTLHAIGASFEGAGIVGTKTWAHTTGGAVPLLILWDSDTGALRAIIEAYALGQMRTGAMSAVATRWMARPEADTMALIGTGKQAMAQVAGVAAVRPLRQVRVFSPTLDKRRAFVRELGALGFSFEVIESGSVREATVGSAIVTLVTRAREPYFEASMAARGTHINAVGAITPERQEFAQDIFARATRIVADEPEALPFLSREFMDHFGVASASWSQIVPLCKLVMDKSGRQSDCDLSVFKAMGTGVADVALGVEILNRTAAMDGGKPLDPPRRVVLRLRAED